jgi:nucleoside-diphosphate-sugar epimerase
MADRTALVLGASGGIGGAVAGALLRHGWRVIALTRAPRKRIPPAGGDPLAQATWIAGDASHGGTVHRAAQGVQAIVHAVNPPGYRRWGERVLPMIDNTIAAAKAAGARIVLPGAIYNYGPDAFPKLRETSPQNPRTANGRVRVELERRLEAASQAGAPVLIVRCGDFFGPAPGNSWFSQSLVTPGKRLEAITFPGRRGVGHAWAYLPDAGETIARLLDRSDELEPFARFHFAGHWDPDGATMTRAIVAAIGRPEIVVKPLPWPLLALAGLFRETPRQIVKMRYLWRAPISLDNGKLVGFLGEEPHTPWPEAVAATLKALDVR